MANEDTHLRPPNRVAEVDGFKGKTILITGGTGFMGKALIEKILRTCPMVDKIYTIVRPKRGETPQNRLSATFKNPVFDKLRQREGDEIFQKVVAVSGDLSEPDLKISTEDRQILIDEVQIIFHLAATVRFNEPFKKAVLFNTRGTKLLLELAKDCKNLLAFSHCSTSYCILNETVIKEKLYPPPADPNVIINMCECMDDTVVTDISTRVTRGYPNTYSFTKALAEDLVKQEMNNLPVILFRPSAVLPAWKDPIPGWVDGYGGAIWLFVVMGRGLFKTVNASTEAYGNIIPVDIAINALIWGTYSFMKYGKHRVYNVTTELRPPWRQIFKISTEINQHKMPLNKTLSYPRLYYGNSRLVYNILSVPLQYVPATIYDLGAILYGRKPMFWKLLNKTRKDFELYLYFFNRNWDYSIKCLKEDSKMMNETERELYCTSWEGFDFKSYIYTCMHGVRLYVLQEKDENIPDARKRIQMWWTLEAVIFMLSLAFVFRNKL